MGLWPARARATVDAAQMQAAEVFPDSLAKVYQLTTLTGDFVVSGGYDNPVSRALALSVPAVQRGVSLLTTTVAGLPMERVDAQGNRVDLGWLNQPEPGRSRFATFTDIGADLIFDGVAYLLVHDRDATGGPKTGGVEYIALDRVGNIIGADGQSTITVDGREVARRDVIGFPGWHDGIRNHGARTIRTALALEAAARRYADTPMAPVTLVNESGYELDDTEIDALLADYKKARNQEGVGYVNSGIKPVVNGFDAAQLQLVEARQFSGTQIANLVGVPAHAIAGAAASAGGSVTYANVTQDNRALVDYGMKVLIRAIESRLSMSDVNTSAWTNQVTPRGTTVRIALDGLLRGNPLERAQLYRMLIPLGVLTVEEARAMEDLAPVGGQQA